MQVEFCPYTSMLLSYILNGRFDYIVGCVGRFVSTLLLWNQYTGPRDRRAERTKLTTDIPHQANSDTNTPRDNLTTITISTSIHDPRPSTFSRHAHRPYAGSSCHRDINQAKAARHHRAKNQSNEPRRRHNPPQVLVHWAWAAIYKKSCVS